MNRKWNMMKALVVASVLASCSSGLTPVATDAIVPTVVTEQTEFDTDDPAIWIHPTDPSKSLIVGTDKEVGGGLYVYDLSGKIVKKSDRLTASKQCGHRLWSRTERQESGRSDYN